MSLRTYACVLMLAAASAWTAFAAGPPIEAFAPLPPEEAGTAVLPPGSATAASELSAAPACHPAKRRAALVALHWQPVPGSEPGRDETPVAQRVELTKFRDGFRTGRLEASRRLAAAVEAVAVDSPETGILYYWRVLTLTPDGWAPSAVERFEVPICPWDEPDLSRFQAGLADDRPEAGS
jgi:hypothetical protein